MTAAVLDSCITLPPVVKLTEAEWKQKASETLQVFGRCRKTADAHAETLYEIYVKEQGFDNVPNDTYKDDPYAAVLDDHDYIPPPSRMPPKTA